MRKKRNRKCRTALRVALQGPSEMVEREIARILKWAGPGGAYYRPLLRWETVGRTKRRAFVSGRPTQCRIIR